MPRFRVVLLSPMIEWEFVDIKDEAAAIAMGWKTLDPRVDTSDGQFRMVAEELEVEEE